MKALIYLLVLIALFAFLANTSIEFKPFKISFASPYYAIGTLVIIIGMAFIKYQGEVDGIKKTMDKITEIVDKH